VRQEPLGVIAKASGLLDQLALDGDATVAELSEALGEPRTSVYRMVRGLQAVGFVEGGGRRGAYRLGLKLFRLGGAVVARFDERQAALPHMEALHVRTGETVFLCVRRGREAVCIERLEGSRAVSLALKLGGSLPLHVGAAPRVLLAAQPRAWWDEYCSAEGALTPFTPGASHTPASLSRDLAEVRRAGYAISDQDVTVGIAAIGAPIRNHRGEITAALSISGVRPAILGDRTDEMIAHVVAAADAASSSLGFDPALEAVAHD
jgi:DNA-binding IclR family transcriptional regulator